MGKTIRTDRARAAFLAMLAEECNVSEACRAAGIGRSSAYAWKAEDPTFAAQWEEAEEEAADKLEKVAWERAKSGQSDRMLEILLKGHRPKYRDKQQVELSGPNGGPIEHKTAARAEIEELFGVAAPTPHEIVEQKQ